MLSAVEVQRAYAAGAAGRSQGAGRLPGRQRRADGDADAEGGLPHRCRADPGHGAAANRAAPSIRSPPTGRAAIAARSPPSGRPFRAAEAASFSSARRAQNQKCMLHRLKGGGFGLRLKFRIAVDQLDRAGAPPELRQKVSDWYAENFIPADDARSRQGTALSDYLPVGAAPYYLQYHYIVANPQPGGAAQAARRRRRRQRIQQAARHLSSADARRRHHGRLLRFHDRRPQIRSPDLHGPEGGGFHHVPSVRSLPPLQRRRRRRPLRRRSPTGQPSASRISPLMRHRAARRSPSWEHR